MVSASRVVIIPIFVQLKLTNCTRKFLISSTKRNHLTTDSSYHTSSIYKPSTIWHLFKSYSHSFILTLVRTASEISLTRSNSNILSISKYFHLVEVPIDNTRYKKLVFEAAQDSVLHGFSGFFDTVLYKDVILSIVPETYSQGMFSWFPIFFPLKVSESSLAKNFPTYFIRIYFF